MTTKIHTNRQSSAANLPVLFSNPTEPSVTYETESHHQITSDFNSIEKKAEQLASYEYTMKRSESNISEQQLPTILKVYTPMI